MGDLALVRAMQEAPEDVRRAALLLYQWAGDRAQVEAISQTLTDGRRARQRRESDQRTDHERRLLVGPRLPRETAERYRAAAQARHLSLYAWAAQALAAQYAKDMGGGAAAPPPAPTGRPPRSPWPRPRSRSGQQNQSCCFPGGRDTPGRRSRRRTGRRRAARPAARARLNKT